MDVRTNIVLDQDLVEEAKNLSGIKTHTFGKAQRRQQAAVRQLRGKFQWEGDLEASRMSRFVDEEFAIDDSR